MKQYLSLTSCLLLTVSALFLSNNAASGQLVDNFTNLAGNSIAPFNGSWNQSGTPQFVQDTGFVTITPVSGGNPTGDGSFDANPVTLGNYSTATAIQLTARLESLNTNSAFNIQLRDNLFAVAATATFSAASFNFVSFTTVQIPIVLGAGNLSNIQFYTFSGDGLSSNNVRVSLDNVAAVPEPSVSLLLALGAMVPVLRRRR